MKEDLDRLMHDRHLDAFIVSGAIRGNPPLYYLTRGARISHALVVKRRDAEPVLVASAMEREEAEAAEMPIVLEQRYGYHQLLKEHAGDPLAANVVYLTRILEDQEITGRVGFYGTADQGNAYVLLRALQEAYPAIEVVGEPGGNDIFTEARATKSAEEAARIAAVGRRTIEVVRELIIYLQQHAVDNEGILRRAMGGPLLVGHVHDHIRRLTALQGLELPEGFIFATGRDGGIPHSRGNPSQPVRLGEPIVFDIYPCEPGGGYFFDLTRTFCLGYAPEPVIRLHEETRACLEALIEELAVGEPTRRYQVQTCDFFRERGHPTIMDDPETLSGYVHSVGHGVGLKLHESPFFRDSSTDGPRLQPGHVFTLEPGLYYPDAGMGCRLEDVLWIDEEGTVHNLSPLAYDLVIPMEG